MSAADGSVNLQLGGIRVVGAPGSVEAGTDLNPRSAETAPPKSVGGVKVAAHGSGIDLSVLAEDLHAPLTVSFPATAPRPGLSPAVAHQGHDGSWELRPASWDGTTAVLASRDFSPNVLVWFDPAKVVGLIKDKVVEFLTGRTPSPGCRGGAYRWSHLEDDEDLVHACLTTNDSAARGQRAELRLTSNRGAYVQVDIPKGADYVWMDGQSQLVRDVIGNSMGVDGDRTVFLAPGAAMTIGWRKPPPERSERVEVTASPRAMALSLVLGGLSLFSPKIDSSTATVTSLAWACAKEQGPKAATAKLDVNDVVSCLVEGKLGDLANPEVALKLSSQWLGASATDGELKEQTARLTKVGSRFVTAGFLLKAWVYVKGVRDALLATWGSASDQLQTAVLGGGGTSLIVTLRLPTLTDLEMAGTWYRHGEKLVLRSGAKSGTLQYRTYTETGSSKGQIFGFATLALTVDSDGKTVLARVTKERYAYEDGDQAPPSTERYQVEDSFTLTRKRNGALNEHEGTKTVTTPDDLAWCRDGVQDDQCGA